MAYRKLVSRTPSELLSETTFGLYAVTARYPQKLSSQVPWKQVQAGVYDSQWGTDTIRVVVARELMREPHNAPLHLFSASPELVGFGGRAYQRHSAATSGLLVQLFEGLQTEGFAMPYTMEDFQRQFVKDHFAKLTPAEQAAVLQSLPPEEQVEVIQSLPAEARLAGLPPEARLAGLPPEARLAGLPPEARLAGLSAKQIHQYLERLSDERPRTTRTPRRKK